MFVMLVSERNGNETQKKNNYKSSQTWRLHDLVADAAALAVGAEQVSVVRSIAKGPLCDVLHKHGGDVCLAGARLQITH